MLSITINGGNTLFNTVGLVSRLDNKIALDLALKIYQYFRKENLKIVPEMDFAKKFGLTNSSSLSRMNVELIITVGGDGTVLKTCMLMPNPETPVLAINMGRRGYLTEVESGEAINAIKKCLRGDYKIEKHDKLSIILENKKLVDGLNEVLITSIMPWKMLDFEVSLNKDHFLSSRADALIVATSTGSTAHSLSAGGPIVHSSLNTFVLIFVCPSEPMPPIILPNDGNIEIKTRNPKLTTLITVDGRYQKRIELEQKFVIRKSEHKAEFIRLGKSYTYKSLLRALTPSRVRTLGRFEQK